MTTADTNQVASLDRPTPEEARRLIERGAERRALVTLYGRCVVEYDGRASANLPAGDRYVLLKPDGTTLVHDATGQQPASWQQPGAERQVAVEDGDLVVCGERPSPPEVLSIRFETVGHGGCFDVTDDCSGTVSGTESDLRRRVLEEPALLEPGFRPLSTERRTPVGPVDVYGEDAEGRTVVVELKRRRVGPDAVAQLRRYVDALDRDLHEDAAIRGILVAPSITDRARELLAENGLEFVEVEPAEDGS